ncbi:hypothetical protein [Marinobacterium iners]|uniref:hypothetical protein n=1 Tax=Marinobacterium iners TaxID=48076 RepID=UPI001A8C2102|nr:hypothetical protein [Marinobacterium iners]
MPNSMKHITEIDTGFMVRKCVNGRKYQAFFGNTRHGGRDQARAAAMQARDELINTLAKNRTLRTYNPTNVTGLAGISWYCKPNQHRNGAVIHQFRAQAPSGSRRALTAIFSVQKHGLWGAYCLAVAWRMEHASPYLEERPDPARTFGHFMQHYLAVVEKTKPGRLHDELTTRLDNLGEDPGTTGCILNMRSSFGMHVKLPSLAA